MKSRRVWIAISAVSLLITLAGSMTLFYLFDKPAFEEGNIGVTTLTMLPFAIMTAYALSRLAKIDEEGKNE